MNYDKLVTEMFTLMVAAGPTPEDDAATFRSKVLETARKDNAFPTASTALIQIFPHMSKVNLLIMRDKALKVRDILLPGE